MADTFPVDALAGYIQAYRHAKERQGEHEQEAKKWHEAADVILKMVDAHLTANPSDNSSPDDGKTTWFGSVAGKTVCRLTRYRVRNFDIKRFREKEPDLADRYTEWQPRTRFTVMDAP